jgi:beta-lactamase regulating signal transducer with metallopeptidase domain
MNWSLAISDAASLLVTQLGWASLIGGLALLAALPIGWLPISARVRCWYWRLAFAKLLIALVWVQPVELPWLAPAASAPVAAVSTAGHADAPSLANDPPPLKASPQIPLAPPASSRSWAIWFSAAWIVGASAMLCLAVADAVRAARMKRDAVDAPASLHALLARAAADVGLCRSVRLALSPSAPGPMLVGIGRPTIILPSGFPSRFSADDLHAMLAHEAAHAVRRDLPWNYLYVAARALFFFHPLVWFAGRRWQQTQEVACDELVLRSGLTRPAAYGRLLLNLAQQVKFQSPAPWAVAGVLRDRTTLERRIVAMTRMKPFSRRRLFLATLVAVAAGSLGLVPWKLVAQPADGSADEALQAKWKTLSEAEIEKQVLHNAGGLIRAAHAYEDEHGVLPPAVVPNPDLPPEKRLSGFVLLLPYLDKHPSYAKEGEAPWYDEETRKTASELAASIDLTKAWDDPVNLPAARTLLPALLVPNSAPLRDEAGHALSHFAFCRGHAGKDNGAYNDDVKVTSGSIEDGTVHTLAIGQVSAGLNAWTAAGPGTSRWLFHPSEPVTKATFGTLEDQTIYAVNCDAFPYLLDLKASTAKGLAKIAAKTDGSVVEPGEVTAFPTKAEARSKAK